MPRLVINRESLLPLAGSLWSSPLDEQLGLESGGGRDAQFVGDCDAGCLELARLLRWEDELRAAAARTSSDEAKS